MAERMTDPTGRFPWTDGEARKADLLRETLQVAVPRWLDIRRCWETDALIGRARECGDVLASEGDLLMFRSPKRHGTARVFNHLAEGIACMLLVADGGRGEIEFLGMRWRLDGDGQLRAEPVDAGDGAGSAAAGPTSTSAAR